MDSEESDDKDKDALIQKLNLSISQLRVKLAKSHHLYDKLLKKVNDARASPADSRTTMKLGDGVDGNVSSRFLPFGFDFVAVLPERGDFCYEFMDTERTIE